MGMMRVRVLDADRVPVPDGEPGEIAFEGPSTMYRYHGLDEATADVLVDARRRSSSPAASASTESRSRTPS
jgi:non-ribosomal peptide synthetase component E (peptide arylation enzyme)